MEQKVSHGVWEDHPGDASSLDQRGTQLTRLVGHVDGGPLHLIPVSPQQSVGLGMDHHTTRGGVAHPRSGRRSRSGARTIQAGGFTWGRSIEPCSNDCAPLNNNCPNPSTLTLSPRRYGLGDPQIIRVPVRTHDASALAYKPDTCDNHFWSSTGCHPQTKGVPWGKCHLLEWDEPRPGECSLAETRIPCAQGSGTNGYGTGGQLHQVRTRKSTRTPSDARSELPDVRTHPSWWGQSKANTLQRHLAVCGYRSGLATRPDSKAT